MRQKKLNPTKHIPYRGSVHFVGREKELTTIHEDLQRGNYVAITGMGGLGKTELVTQYATQYQDNYGGIIWFNARESSLAAEVFEFFTFELGLEIPKEQRGKLLTLKQQIAWCWLQYPQTQLPVLIVVDDLTDLTHLQEVVPKETRFRILTTTRLQHLDHNYIQQLPLEILSPPSALELLQKQLGKNDQRVVNEPKAAEEICQFLEYLPLGIILVGSYLIEDSGLSLTEIWGRLQKRKLAEAALQKRETINQTQLGVKAAFNLTWEKLDTQTQYLGAFLSLFSPQLIVWDLVVWVNEFEVENEEKQVIWTKEELTTAKKQLYKVNFLQKGQQSPEAYKIHNLVRWFLQEQLAEAGEMQPVLERTFISPIIYLASQLPQSPTSEDIENFKSVVFHWEDLGQRLIDETKEKTAAQTNLPVSMLADEISWVFIGLGIFYEGQGLYQLAEFWQKKCVELCQSLFTGDHSDVATSLNNLASFYNNQGRYSEARPLYSDALEMTKRLFTGDHPNVATSLNNLASLYHSQGWYSQAKPLYLDALEMRKRLFIGDHPDVATSLNNLAFLYKSQGQYSEAESLYRDALEMRKRLFTGDHPDVAASLNNLASLYKSQGQYSEVELLYRDALDMRIRLFTSDHPDVAQGLNNLALFYNKQRRYSEAELLYHDALNMTKRLFTGDHPDVAAILDNLASLYNSQGRYSEAEPLYRDALDITKRLFTGDHSDVATILHNLAALYDNQGRYSEAEPLYLESLEMLEQVLGVNHPTTITVRNNLRYLQQQLTSRSFSMSRLRYLLAILALPFYRLWLFIKRIFVFCLRLI